MSIRELTAHRASVLNEHVRIFVLDEPGPGGACHDYVTLIPITDTAGVSSAADAIGVAHPDARKTYVMDVIEDGTLVAQTFLRIVGAYALVEVTLVAQRMIDVATQFGSWPPVTYFRVQRITFQNGPLKDAGGANGTSHEVLLAIILDRLAGFQAGKFNCHDNEVAATHLETALLWLKKRTWDRIARGVEGVLKP